MNPSGSVDWKNPRTDYPKATHIFVNPQDNVRLPADYAATMLDVLNRAAVAGTEREGVALQCLGWRIMLDALVRAGVVAS